MARFVQGAAVLLGLMASAGSIVWPAGAAQDGTTGLPLPRFVSLRAEEVNLRTGPGVRYPVEWIYQRRNLPVEVIAEYGTWRKIRDWQGTQGWVHQSMLSGRRSVIVIGEQSLIRRKPNEEAPAMARVEAGALARLLECKAKETWCRVESHGFEGWLKRTDLWGIYAGETVE